MQLPHFNFKLPKFSFSRATGDTPHAAQIRIGRIGIQDKINFARHLAIMVRAGMPLLEGLKIIRRQTTSKKLLVVIDQLILDINNGQSMGVSLKRFKHVFGDFFISIVEVGEASGTLAANLLYLAEEMKKAKELHGKVKAAMIYPIILLVMTIAVSGFLTFFVFPKLLPTFADFDVELPVSTQILITVLNFLAAYWWFVIAGFVALIIGWRALSRWRPFKFAIDRIVVSLPVVSRLVVDVNMANMTRIMAILLQSGVKIVEATIIVSNTFENLVYQQAFLKVADEIKKGGTFSEFLTKEKNIFPPILSAMIEVGENTGNLEENLTYLSGYYSEEIETSLKNLTALLEPLILLIMGLLVGFVALSIITPIYTISQGLQQ